MRIFDISRSLTADLAPWPGDVGFSFRLNGRIAEGASVNVGSMTMSVHNGSHADARYHFEDDGWTIEQAQLELYFGPAAVVDASGDQRWEIRIDDLSSAPDAPRLLIKTNVWRDSTVFPQRIPTIARDVPEWLRARGVKLLGIDLPSVDEITSRDLPNHHALAAAGVSIIESLDLSAVEAGVYNFVGLPLKIAGADGSPIRAILWRE